VEWYDFFVYGTAAALVFGRMFFPPDASPLVGSMAAFAAFSPGFVDRPLGGLLILPPRSRHAQQVVEELNWLPSKQPYNCRAWQKTRYGTSPIEERVSHKSSLFDAF
jgi:UPF0716 family protein affecting phage T7 exclusion